MELRQLRVFEAVVAHRTVTAAATELGLAPSSVSEQVRALERSLGVALFRRGPRGMTPTPAGERLLPRARGLRELAERARREVTDPAPEVRLGALETIAATYVPAVLARLERRRPGLAVRVHAEAARDELLAAVAAGELDAALVLDLGAEVGGLGFAVPDGPLEFVDLTAVPLVLVAAPGHRLAGVRRVDPAVLRDEELLVNVPACSFHLAGRHLFGDGVRRRRAGGVAVTRAWTERGLGISLLPGFAVEDALAAGTLTRLDVATPEVSLRLVWRADRETGPGVRALLYATGDALTARVRPRDLPAAGPATGQTTAGAAERRTTS